MCFNHYIGVIIALFDPLFERIVYLTNSLVDEGRKEKLVTLMAANIYTARARTRDHMTTHPIEPFHLYSRIGTLYFRHQLISRGSSNCWRLA
jgi:hypothetical protein